ncbi:TadE family protein [Petroclostridium sp. X23]|jgi:Flp pilus assembly protein TadG|uniref:TadE/TadG family type IV pilus assembly protein n=1 Tax=Petroclostridium sp. X23 TaxID=3045146 RepID=UPI0024AE48F0|nr:TadE family protein [Petroclostridium sp. X23]WHH60540.1 pilus assembly protein [Petroclostridium sp. X23]
MTLLKVLRDQRGQSIVEAAMVLPILLLILFSVFEFGRIFNAYMIITNAAREGARCAVVGTSDIDVINVININTSTLDASKRQISVSPTSSSRTRGVQVAVQIDYKVEIITPLISSMIPNPFPLRAKTVMRME